MKLGLVLLVAVCLVDAKKKRRGGKRTLDSSKPKYCEKTDKNGQRIDAKLSEKTKPSCKCFSGWKKIKDKTQTPFVVKCAKPISRYTKGLPKGTVVEVGGRSGENINESGDRECRLYSAANILDCTKVGLVSKELNKYYPPGNIEAVDYSYNHFNTLDPRFLNGLFDLTNINLRGNFIKDLPLKFLASSFKLKELDVSHNQLSRLSNSRIFARNRNVEKLYLNDNVLSEIMPKVLNSLDKLTHIYLQNNRLGRVVFGHFRRAIDLEHLDVSNNQLTKIGSKAFENNKRCKTLLLNHNQIGEINKKTFKALPDLLTLALEHNNITKIHKNSFGALVNLKKLTLNNNKIQKLHADQFSKNAALEHINMDHNDIDQIDSETFKNLENLKYLFARNNKIASLSGDMFKFNDNLALTFMSHNGFDNFPEDLLADKKTLKRVDFGDNAIPDLGEVFKGSQDSLMHAYFYDNKISSVHDDLLNEAPVLESIDFENNQISGLNFIKKAIQANRANAANQKATLNRINLNGNLLENPQDDDEFKGESQIDSLFNRL
jgi:Leucine-rich repeat (LRR) protein